MFSYAEKLASFNCNPLNSCRNLLLKNIFLNMKVCTRVDLLFPGQRGIRDIPPQRTNPVVIL